MIQSFVHGSVTHTHCMYWPVHSGYHNDTQNNIEAIVMIMRHGFLNRDSWIWGYVTEQSIMEALIKYYLWWRSKCHELTTHGHGFLNLDSWLWGYVTEQSIIEALIIACGEEANVISYQHMDMGFWTLTLDYEVMSQSKALWKHWLLPVEMSHIDIRCLELTKYHWSAQASI